MYDDGPYVQIACFCENIIEDKFGSLSLIRIVDTITHSEAGNAPPETMSPFTYNLKLVVSLKSGMARGRNTITITPELPDGSSKTAINLSVHFDGEEKGQNVLVDMAFTFTLEGLYWFNVALGDIKITSIPIRVRYNRVVTSTG